mgnify:CR=1 FL=1
MSHQKYHIIDLFAGVGGLSLGATRAGFNLALAVELDKHAIAAHQLNFPGSKHLPTDISGLSGNQVMHYASLTKGELDGLIGGPPCQGFSMMGRRSASDPRNNLFIKFFELVRDCLPKFFVVENVPGLLNKEYDKIRDIAISYVNNHYTILHPLKFKASDFGAATSRERVFFVGYRPETVIPLSRESFEIHKVNNLTTVADALRGLPSQICSEWLTEEQSWRVVEPLPDSPFWNRMSDIIPDGTGDQEAVRRYKEENLVSGCFGTRHTPEVMERYKNLKPGEKDRISKSVRLASDGLCPTLRAGTGPDRGSYQAVRPIHPTLPRVITPREAARLQGFPDWFQFAPSKWHSFRQIGNSVSPILAEVVCKVIRDHLVPKA